MSGVTQWLVALGGGKWLVVDDTNLLEGLPKPKMSLENAPKKDLASLENVPRKDLDHEDDGLSRLAMACDAWLLSVASSLSFRLHALERRELFEKILGEPTVEAAVLTWRSKQLVGSNTAELNKGQLETKEDKSDICWSCKEEECMDASDGQLPDFWIWCERCERWFHMQCVGITKEESEAVPHYICSSCIAHEQG